ncbi:IgGFc-binding protein-like isoform X2 [Engraulis encrasicolus]
MKTMGSFSCLAILLFCGFSAADWDVLKPLPKPDGLYTDMGMCWIMGNPHFRTFDSTYYNFMGNCTYMMASSHCGDGDGVGGREVPFFAVEVKSQKRPDQEIPVVEKVTVRVYDYTFTFQRQEYGIVRYDDNLWYLPMSPDLFRVVLLQSGMSVQLVTDFGLEVLYDWKQYLVVMLPESMRDKTCGLCGNFNSKGQDDLLLPNGSPAGSISELGNAWKVRGAAGDANCGDMCDGHCEKCQSSAIGHLANKVFCNLMTDLMNGPLKECSAIIPKKVYHDYCMYDVCMGKGMKNFLCDTLQVYSDACQRAGFRVFNWRSLAGCPNPQCPKNSHYEHCGTACPATCANRKAESNCISPCVASCVCDEGFVLTGNKCVRESQCGCLYKKTGSYVPPGTTFWTDNCEESCTCEADGHLKCTSNGCPSGKECKVVKGKIGCHPSTYGTCTISGDPHYKTFDKHAYDFQGTCTYAAAKACHIEDTDLQPFSVVVENEKWSSEPNNAVAKAVVVEVYGQTFVLRINQVGVVMVDGVLTNVPCDINEGQVKIYNEGWYVVLKTDFGLRVTYDLVYRVTITVPSSYHEKTCGLCGNFNHNKYDEYRLPDGKETRSIKEFAASWKESVHGVVCDDGCTGDNCPQCPEHKKSIFENDCHIIKDPKGPFAACLNVIDPESYFRDCVYDVCMGDGDRHMLCHSIAAYVTDCQDFGVDIGDWRTSSFCPLSCPDHSHYKICGQTCDKPCPGLTSIACPETCAEGCACDHDYFYNGTGCIKWDECSCYYDGHTYKIGETVVNDDCTERYTCEASGKVKVEKIHCKSDEICKVKEGVRKCYQRDCLYESDGAFTTFSGHGGNVDVSGAFEIIKLCDGALVEEFFRVVVKLAACGNSGLKRVEAVYVFFEDMAITINAKHETWVNGKRVNLPVLFKNEISVKISEETVVVEKISALRVTYTVMQEISVTVSDHFTDKVCGACGKDSATFTVDSKTINKWMDKWRAPDFPSCDL